MFIYLFLIATLLAFGTSAETPQYYHLMTKVIIGDIGKNGFYIVPIQVSNNSTGQNYAAVIPPNSALSANRRPGFLDDFYQEFLADNTTIAFVLPGVDIKHLSDFGNVFMNVNDPARSYAWNSGFSLDGERGLVFTYAGEKVLSGWIVCGLSEHFRLYWTWDERPELSRSSRETCALVELVPHYLPMPET